ncbi:hypothetical protein [Lewinella cohaerens]|uniref:hypothetical protein n=1 Tax=Lewinella cohaerens TaxID=70995 RepID=UPI000362EBE0|nr:hypothetical protein [Lewinella cohaerens]
MTIKYFPVTILLFSIVLTSSPSLFGQDNGLRMGVQAQMVSQLTSTTPFRMSMGNSLGVWGEVPISKSSTLRLTASHRSLNGLQLNTSTIYNEYVLREYRRNISSTMLNSLQYVDLELSWNYKHKASSPWTMGLGVHTSFLHTWRGAQQTSSWIHTEKMRFSANSATGTTWISGGWDVYSRQSEEEALSRSAFQSLDMGGQLHLSYRISRGLDLHLSYLQGFRNLFKDTLFGQATQFYASSLALGLSARLF